MGTPPKTRHNTDAQSKAARSAVALARSTGRRGTWIATGVLIAFFAAVIVLVVRTAGRPGQGSAAAIPTTPVTTATGRTTPPPWTAPVDVVGAVRAAGLPMLSSEGTVEHIHAHLDVLVNGRPVPVPADIGIDQHAGSISPLHTHDASGVIHIESPVQASFTLAQFFTEWQLALAQDHIGGLTATGGNTLRAYVNGAPVSGDPAAVPLHAHDEIALVFGPATGQTPVPATYSWPPGE